MAQYGRRRAWTILTWPALMCGFLLAADPLAAQPEETETRDFRVKIDDKQAGAYHMTIKRNGDGTVAITAQGAVKVSYLIFGYTYSYQGTEVWKNGRLWQLNSKANDDGKKYVVSAAATDTELRVTTNGKSRSTRWDVWTTTYWHAPDAKFRGQIVPLLDAATGKDINSNLELVGAGRLEVA